MIKLRFHLLPGLLLLTMVLATAGCAGSGETGQAKLTSAPAKPWTEIALAPESALPDFVQTASPQVKEAYRFAVANPDILSQIPCYCGCGKMGHKHNLNCYVKTLNPDGSVAEFDNHAIGCTLCVDITRDVMRMEQAGEELVKIRAYIDHEYSRFGPPTDTGPAGSNHE